MASCGGSATSVESKGGREEGGEKGKGERGSEGGRRERSKKKGVKEGREEQSGEDSHVRMLGHLTSCPSMSPHITIYSCVSVLIVIIAEEGPQTETFCNIVVNLLR